MLGEWKEQRGQDSQDSGFGRLRFGCLGQRRLAIAWDGSLVGRKNRRVRRWRNKPHRHQKDRFGPRKLASFRLWEFQRVVK